MSKRLDPKAAARLRKDARSLEAAADSAQDYPAGTLVERNQGPSRIFNLRLTDEQYAQLAKIARKRHLPVSTMARAWLLDRLEREEHAS